MRQSIHQFIKSIENSEDGPQVAAFFDFDKTIISGYSAQAYLWEQVKKRKLSASEMRDQALAATQFAQGTLNFSGLVTAMAGVMKGKDEAEFWEIGERVFNKKIAGAIYPEARDLIDAHRAKGHTIAIISSATIYQIKHAAEELDIEHIMCTDLEMENGLFTGDIVRPPCFGGGKRIAAEKFCAEQGTEMEDSFFYTDSDDDLPLSEAIGHSRVVNPSKRLERIAMRESWPICYFEDRGRPSLIEIAKMGSTYSMIPTSIAMSLPLWVLTGRKRSVLNSAFSLWADYASALTGLTYDITGEENLWAARPAVFIFNHQSAADTVIMAKLLRRDFTGIGKQEIKKMPIVGASFKFADVIFIDRSDSTKAIDAMKPVVTAIKEDNLSVVLAPEGTRSAGRNVGAFKKGAFHIAMQAGVPIVPVVIHNASDSMPKGRQVARAAEIRVTVLPPVETKKWKLKDLNKNVAKVRQMFLDELGQADHLLD